METTEKKSNLTQAFERIEKLNLGISLNKSLDLSDILYTLATEQYNKGLKTANEIHNKYNNL
jgi:hypothetical protein